MKIENDLGKDDIKRLVIRIAIPSMLAQFVNVLYSVVDRMYIGNIAEIGEKALAGVGVCRTHRDDDIGVCLTCGNRRFAAHEHQDGRGQRERSEKDTGQQLSDACRDFGHHNGRGAAIEK